MRKNLRTFYNQDVVSEKLKVADDCIFEVIGEGQNKVIVSAEEWMDLVEEWDNRFIPYFLMIEQDEIIRVWEKYVP